VRRLSRAAATAVSIALALCVALPGSASADTNGPTIGGKVLSDGTLAILWTPDAPGLFQSYEIIDDGSLLFGATLVVALYNPHPFNETVNVSVVQFSVGHVNEPVPVTEGNATVYVNESVEVRLGSVWVNTSFGVPARAVSQGSVAIPNTPQGVTLDDVAYVGSVSWGFNHLTPTFLFPQPTTTEGYFLLGIGEAFEAVVLCGIASVYAKRTMRKPGIGAPKVSLTIGVAGLSGGLFLWYFLSPISFLQFLGGESPFAVPPVLAVIYYFWSLRHHDESEIIEAEQPHFTVPLTYSKLWLRFDTRATDQKTYLVRRNLRGFAYPLLGYPVEVDMRVTHESGEEGEAFGAGIREIQLAKPAEVRQARQAIRTLARLGLTPPAKVVSQAKGWTVETDDPDGPKRKYKIDSGAKVSYRPARFRWTVDVSTPVQSPVPGGPTLTVTKRRFSPHVEPGVLRLPLAGIHAADEEAAAVDGKGRENLARSLEDRSLQVLHLERKITQEADRMATERVQSFLSQLAQESAPHDEADAALEVERLRSREDRKHGVGNGDGKGTEPPADAGDEE
jgi:hypothetical protein